MAAGATLDELFKVRQGLYPKWFISELIAIYELNIAIRMHVDDANYVRPKKAGKK